MITFLAAWVLASVPLGMFLGHAFSVTGGSYYE
jgi:hypothetical protein